MTAQRRPVFLVGILVCIAVALGLVAVLELPWMGVPAAVFLGAAAFVWIIARRTEDQQRT
jgi:hypothetical protein